MKENFRKLLPGSFEALRSIKFFIKCRKRFWKHQQRIRKLLFPDSEIRVLTGPFQGLNYYNKTIWGAIVPKWLGSYESHLIPVVNEIIDLRPKLIVDIGAAEGYYAVGLAKILKESEVIAFDIDPIARFRQRQLARLNQVKNLQICGFCSSEKLHKVAEPDCVIVCDIEGAEMELMNPVKSPNLIRSKLLIECHRWKNLGPNEVAEEISQRFSRTHSIRRIGPLELDLKAWRESIPALETLRNNELEACFDEGRDICQIWLWMKPAGESTAQPA